MKSKEDKDQKEQNIQGLWDNYKSCNMYVMGIPGERETFEIIMTENFPKLMSDPKSQIQVRDHQEG